MKRETILWTIVLVISGVFLLLRGTGIGGGNGMGRAYVKDTPVVMVPVDTAEDGSTIYVDANSADVLDYDITDVPEGDRITWTKAEDATYRDYLLAEKKAADTGAPQMYRLSLSRTIGIWIAAFFTLAILSFLYKDNPFYKIAEAVVVGVSAAYWMVIAFWDQLIPNLLGNLTPGLIKNWAMPGLDTSGGVEWLYLVPLVLGIMLLWRLAPVGGWISRWPMAFIIGVFVGIRLVAFIHADFLSQIANTIIPLVDGSRDASGALTIDWMESVRNTIIVVGVLASVVYFFFSFEHKGVVGKTARLGIWFLMVTFGAAFGYTVMGRIALLSIRLEFLFDDWLWLIDPKLTREIGGVAMLFLGGGG
ncbi:MAG: hypothetical protein KC983_02290 [Phycisphaerales bacterium]|nr:hypothetical protein [Phycisphaerales bacterium]